MKLSKFILENLMSKNTTLEQFKYIKNIYRFGIIDEHDFQNLKKLIMTNSKGSGE